MKTIRLLLLMAAIVSIACISCSKYEAEESDVPELKNVPTQPYAIDENRIPIQSWTENFVSAASLSTNWRLFGKPSPKWVSSFNEKQGLFDNNGPSPTKNYAVSNRLVGKNKGYTLEGEVMILVTNESGSCVCPGIALSREIKPIQNSDIEIPTSISMKIVYAGYNATWFPKDIRGHTWFIMELLTENGNVVSSGYIPADPYVNSWHQLKIEVTEARFPKFYCDNKLLWAPFVRLNPLMMSDKKVVLGYTSDGNTKTMAGVAFHNWVKATYPVGPEF
jgi:hypothetical protein